MHKKQGISLIETLISLTIVSLSIIALLPVMTIRKEANDVSRGNRYWTNNSTYYQPQYNVAIGTRISNGKFIVDATGFKNSSLLPLNITERLDWDGQIIEAPANTTLYIRREDAATLISKQHIYIDANRVIVNNGTLSGTDTITKPNDAYTVSRGDNVYSLSNQNKEYLFVDATNNIIAIGENAGEDIDITEPKNEDSILIFNKDDATFCNDDNPVCNPTFFGDGSLAIGLNPNATSTQKDFREPGDWIIYRTNGGNFTINANVETGTITASAVILPSDERLKNILTDYTRGLDEILKIKPVEFTYKKDENKRHHIGVIAQDLKKVLPEAVSKNKEGYYMVSTEPIFYSFINAIKELNNKNIELKKNNDKLEQKIAKLKEIKANLEKGGNDEK